MDDKEAIQMMERCMAEIRLLRNTNNAMAPKAEAFEVISKIMGYLPGRSQGYSEDLVWVLEKRIRELQPKPAEKETD